MTQEEVFEAIESERDYQNRLTQCQLSPAEEILLLEEYVKRAREKYAGTFADSSERPAMNTLRKCAAICVRAMENHEVDSRPR